MCIWCFMTLTKYAGYAILRTLLLAFETIPVNQVNLKTSQSWTIQN